MSLSRLVFRQQVLQTPHGAVLGSSYRWPGGQYCAIHTDRGIIACGLYDCAVATRFGMILAIARGTPELPLKEPEDLFQSVIVEVSADAHERGITTGMTGLQALEKLLADE
ncbi:MAG: DUF1805 domain-containing protein [Zavarzinella sp.]